MIWEPYVLNGRTDRYAIRSADKCWSVCKVGEPPLYEAWRTALHPLGRLRLGGFKTAGEAKARVERENPVP